MYLVGIPFTEKALSTTAPAFHLRRSHVAGHDAGAPLDDEKLRAGAGGVAELRYDFNRRPTIS